MLDYDLKSHNLKSLTEKNVAISIPDIQCPRLAIEPLIFSNLIVELFISFYINQ